MDTCSLFEEDEVYVYKAGKGYKFGLILENSEYVSSDDEDEDSDKPEDRLQKGSVRIAWHPSGKETVVPENKVKLVDRSLMPGDVVRRLIPGEDTQCGFVMNMEVRAHLHIMRSNKYIYNVDSRDLVPIQKFECGQEVILDLWWGKVDNVVMDTVLVFADGAKCRVDEGDIVMYEDVTEKQRHGEFSMCLHYPGQELRGPIDALSDAKWLHSTPRYCHRVANKPGKHQSVNVTIEKIETRSVEVHWVFCGNDGPDGIMTAPARVVEGEALERLKILDWFSGCSLQLGDRMLHRVKNDDVVVTVEPGQAFDPKTAMIKEAGVQVAQSAGDAANEKNKDDKVECKNNQQQKEGDDDDTDFEDVDDDEDSDVEGEKSGSAGSRATTAKSKKKFKGFKNLKFKTNKPNQKGASKKRGKERVIKPDMLVEVEAEFTTSWAKVMWQDGSVQNDVPSVELFPVHHLDELEFFPGDFVLPNIELELPEPADYGVVTSADHSERTCKVHWYKVYDAGKATADSAPVLVQGNSEMSVYDLKDHTDYKFRPGQSVVPVAKPVKEEDGSSQKAACQTVGQIYELDPNGHLVVKWVDGSISQRFPQELFIVGDEGGEDTDNDWDSESDYESNDSSKESWETESEQEVVGEEEGNKVDKDDSGCDQGILVEHKQELDSLLGRAESALARLQKLLNNFDVSVSAPDCFHDIIRIYRNCHDLDKILKSSFFSDPELMQLISQAKQELKRDKTNKISRHLTQLFEAWSQTMPASGNSARTFGVIGENGKTITFSPLKGAESRKDNEGEISLSEPNSESQDNCGNTSAVCGASGGQDIADVTEKNTCESEMSTSNEVSCSNCVETRGLKKEFSEPAIGSMLTSGSERRPSDPTVESINAVSHDAKKTEANLVGENCVAKASKRVKSDALDESGREAKKSRDDSNRYSNQMAQELCFKICKCLQKQILLIHEDMNKRTQRLFSSIDKHSSTVAENATDSSQGTTLTRDSVVEGSKDESNAATAAATSCDKEPSNPVIHDTPVITSQKKEAPAEHVTDMEHGETKGDTVEPSNTNDADAECEGALDQDSDEQSSSFNEIQDTDVPCKGFQMDAEVPLCHAFVQKESQPSNARAFRNAVKKELKLFQTSLPDGIFVHGFTDRLDLYSVMILGPEGTPYEDAVFLFDIMLPNDYPSSPPVCHYHSYCSDRLNPNLYEDGKVCVSLLGTWSGKGNEMWTNKSTLLQVLLSIQGLILVPEPYYNEAGFERQRGTQVGEENSRMYNEMAILKTCQSLTLMCKRPPITFKEEVQRYLLFHGPRMISRLQHWMEMSQSKKSQPKCANADCSNGTSYQPSNAPNIVEPPKDVGDSSSSVAASMNQTNEASSDKGRPDQNGCLSTEACSQEVECCNKMSSKPQTDTTQCQGNQFLLSSETHCEAQSSSSVADTDPKATEPQTLSTRGSGNSDSTSPATQNTSRKQEENSSEVGDSCVEESKKAEGEETVLSSMVSVSHQLQGLSLDPNTLNGQDVNPAEGVCKSSVCNESGQRDTDKTSRGPDFPLFPISKGFCITLQNHLRLYKKSLEQLSSETVSNQ